ncbi:hypothetical protein [Rhodopseudomonas sp. RCAM05734]|uniref:hypothetical protein n=1 Tax=Rhodopseudomonas sp. RCAM05734 TaxID=3457549 RepID=UPI004043E828
MSEHPTNHNSASDAEIKASTGETATDAVTVESPKLAPEHGDGAKSEVVKPDVARIGASRAEASRGPGKIMIMSPQRERSWEDYVDAEAQAEHEQRPEGTGKRRMSAVTAVVLLAALTGATGGSLATAGFGHLFGNDDSKSAVAQTRALEETVARLDADVAALKIGAERTSRQATSAFSKTGDRLDKIEKAQAEPAAKLAKLGDSVAKLGEAVEKLQKPPAPVAAPVASVQPKEVTGSIAPPAPAPKPELARLPTVDGWVLHDVSDGGATIEGRQGIFEVYAGDPVPGLGRIDAIRKQDGRWVVVTSKGLIVAR